MNILKTKNRTIEYKLIRKKIKRITIAVKRGAEVIVTVPYGVDKNYIQQLMEEKSSWIEQKVEMYIEKEKNEFDIKAVQDEYVPLLGEQFRVDIIEEDKVRMKSYGELKKNGILELHIKKIKDSSRLFGIETKEILEERQKAAQACLESFYRIKAYEVINEAAEYYAEKIGVKFNNLTIKSGVRVWGSCSTKRNINFNVKLVLFDIDIIDYVVVHELCHLLEMNHSKAFWNLVEKYLPEYKSKREWLHANGHNFILE